MGFPDQAPKSRSNLLQGCRLTNLVCWGNSHFFGQTVPGWRCGVPALCYSACCLAPTLGLNMQSPKIQCPDGLDPALVDMVHNKAAARRQMRRLQAMRGHSRLISSDSFALTRPTRLRRTYVRLVEPVERRIVHSLPVDNPTGSALAFSLL